MANENIGRAEPGMPVVDLFDYSKEGKISSIEENGVKVLWEGQEEPDTTIYSMRWHLRTPEQAEKHEEGRYG